MWIYIDDQFVKAPGGDKKKASQSFENNMSMTVLAKCLGEKGIDHGKIGIEKKALQVPIWEELKKTFPDAIFIDSGPLFYDARYVKTPYEIECLRHAAESQENILFETMGEISIGISHADILRKLRSKALGTFGIDKIRFMFVSVGKNYAPCSVPYQINVAPGDLIKYDGALVVRGYGGDCGRTFIAGKPSADQERIHRILLSGHEEALKLIRPGVKPKDIFEKTMKTVQENGLPNYDRGHIGHSVGLDQTVEEPPFISPYSENPMVPGNVFCLELPYYAYGFGSIQFEDIVLVTEDGHELLTKSSKLLNSIGC
jgi:Xaa-Pro aminopeptidase